ncbi:MAG: tyrosine-type recombinase/integrase [Acidobacteriota bacterium]|nr:tyrosine-type recombinase/integrase [Acidobacteriota bacterium]
MVFSVFTRHSSGCKFKRDRLCRRCSCPKWVGGQVNKEYFRQSASTRIWDEAEQLRDKLEEALLRGLPPFGSQPKSALLPAPAESRLLPTALSLATVSTAQPERNTDEDASQLPPPPAPAPAVNAPSAPPAEFLPPNRQKARVTVQKAVAAYMTDARSRGLKSDTIKKLERIFEKQFLPWTRAQGLEYLDEIDLDALLSFRSTWTEGAIVRAKKQDRVIGFFWDCFRRNFITQNPALSLSKIKTTPVPTDYFPRDEFDKITAAIEVYGDARGGFIPIEDTRTRLRTLTLLMRWSGLRIRDAVTLERHRLHGDSLLLYQAKTGQAVYVPLPDHVIDALVNIPDGPRPNPRYFFWSGNGNAKSVVADWQRAYRRLFELADIRKLDGEKKRCHPHMFRDTFAVEMLLAGVPIDQVSTLLGHSSVKITERHYAPFVKARQLQLQASVREAWKVGDFSDKGPDNQPPKTAHPLQPKQRGWELIKTKKKLRTA